MTSVTWMKSQQAKTAGDLDFISGYQLHQLRSIAIS
jgi:hypothetical protein